MPDETFRMKVTLVTGGAGSIGRAITARFSQAGTDVAINFRKAGTPSHKQGETLRDEVTAIGRRAVLLECDIAKRDAVTLMLQQVEAQLGRLDFLILNAAKTPFKPIERLLERELRQLVEINFLGNIFCIQAALPLLEKTGGKILFISSLGARFYFPNYPLGSMKAAMESTVRDLAESLRGRGIGVYGLCGGIVRTDMIRVLRMYWEELAQLPDDLYVEPDDIAEAALSLCGPAGRGMEGQTLVVDRGLSHRLSLSARPPGETGVSLSHKVGPPL